MIPIPKDPLELLKTRQVYDILDGDTTFHSSQLNDSVSLPYQSGQQLTGILRQFGISRQYDSSSRWTYVEELMDHCVETRQISKLFTFFFDLRQFRKSFQGLNAEEISQRHEAIVAATIEAINGILLFSNHELRKMGDNYAVIPIDGSPAMEVPSIKQIDRSYVKDLADRAQQDIDRDELDSALTKARTLLEEVFCQVIERKGQRPSTKGDINKLFSQAKDLYNIHADKNTDRRICDLINGLNKIVDSVAQMRNAQSDAHGVGAARVHIGRHHARLAVNAATNVADFMLSVAARAECREGQ